MKLIKPFVLLLFGCSLILASCGDCTEKTWYEDKDGDGFGNALVSQMSCDNPGNFVNNADDVDDNNAGLNPNTVWTGAALTFTKENNADWTNADNQDRITDNVWLTRQDNKGLFNIVTEVAQVGTFDTTLSPADTEWAVGSISDGISTLSFDRFVGTLQNNVGDYILNGPLVLHLITDDIYMDVNFTAWSMGNTGGGLSYTRSTKN